MLTYRSLFCCDERDVVVVEQKQTKKRFAMSILHKLFPLVNLDMHAPRVMSLSGSALSARCEVRQEGGRLQARLHAPVRGI